MQLPGTLASLALYTFNKRCEVEHIFSRVNGQVKHEHLEDTPLNRRMLLETILNKKNLQGIDKFGVESKVPGRCNTN